MDFTWGHAIQVALIGFCGVFVILFVLQVSLVITNKLVRRFVPKQEKEKREKDKASS